MSERVVLVTGGTRGIGAAIARAFLGDGDTVVVCGRRAPEELPSVGGGAREEPSRTDSRAPEEASRSGSRAPEEPSRSGSRALEEPPAAGARQAEFVAADVREPEAAPALIGAVRDRHGRLDLLVNNAGGTAPGPAAEMSAASAEGVVALNLLAPFHLSQAANAVMQEQAEGGQIVNIGSVAEVRPAPGTAVYAAAKAGLLGLTRALALEWGPKVRVNQVTPGLVETEGAARHYGGEAGLAAVRATIPAGRMARPEDIAAACLLLANPAAAHVNGAELRVDGGGEVPGWLVAVKGAAGT